DCWVCVEGDADGVCEVALRCALDAGGWDAYCCYDALVTDTWLAWDKATVDFGVGVLRDVTGVVVAGGFGLDVAAGVVEASDEIANAREPAALCFY
ncbi:hypothetical protein V491_08704, partial [Pseudogymnoascus sp. VKM F-3775]